jgi:ABC-2 type transport system ATP-binding protein
VNAINTSGLKKAYPVLKGYKELFLHPFKKQWVQALNGIDLKVNYSECFCLLGPNGAGKTTLIKVLMTLVLPDEGDAWVNGFSTKKDANRIKSSVGYAINDERSFYWRLTGRQNLDFFAVLNGLSGKYKKKKIEEILELTELKDAAGLRFNTYSTGMRQMLALARALLPGPEVLFVDEPTRSLDPQSARKIRVFLREELVGTQKKTVFWTTHNLSEAQEYSHKIAVIDKGKIKITGTVNELTQNGERSLQDVYDAAVSEESSNK